MKDGSHELGCVKHITMFTYKSLDHRKIPGFWHKKAPICFHKYHTELKKEMIRKRTSCEWRIDKMPRNSNCSKRKILLAKHSWKRRYRRSLFHHLPTSMLFQWTEYMRRITCHSIPSAQFLSTLNISNHKKEKSKWYEIRKTVFSVCNKAWCSRIRLDRAKCSMFICQCSG